MSRLNIKLTPGAYKNELVSYDPDLFGDKILKVMITEIPEKGRANQALITFLAKALRLPKSSFKITQGVTSRSKLIEVVCDQDTLEERIEALISLKKGKK
jgi:uncharacterized protein YggU (UPF0235/DUF167 family)